MLYPLTEEIWVGKLVLAVFCEDGCIYRARILNTREVECEVEFYDFGTISVCQYDQLFFYDETHFDFVPPLVRPIKTHLNQVATAYNERPITTAYNERCS